MGQVSITIRGRAYQIACDDGQEAHLARLGRYLDQRAEQLASGGGINDALLLVMVGLVVADELSDALAELESLRGAGALTARAAAEAETVATIDAIAGRIERIAARLTGA
ncbi:MAG: cell division protein ZapA [Candidatus Binataceae bacterium]